VVTIEEGWDSLVLEVDGEYSAARLGTRVLGDGLRLVPKLAPALPVAVPGFEHVADGLRAVAYRKLAASASTPRVRPSAVGSAGSCRRCMPSR